MSTILDLGVLYYIGKKLVTPFTDWKAFKLGIIDEHGRTLRTKLTTYEEKDSWTYLDKFIRNLRLSIGDSTFLKLSLLILFTDAFKANKVDHIKENITEENILNQIKENLQIGLVSMDFNLSEVETIHLYYKDHEDGLASFSIQLFLGSEYVNGIVCNFMLKKDAHDLIDILNSQLISNEMSLTDFTIGPIDIRVNSSDTEFKVNKGTRDMSKITANLFIPFQPNTRPRFLQSWNQFYQYCKQYR